MSYIRPSKSSDELEAEIDRAQREIVPGIDDWLGSLEGKKFDTKEIAKQQVDTIVRIVRKAGRRLLLNGHPVTVSVLCGTRQTRPTIQVLGRESGKRVVLLSSISMPLFSTGPTE